MNRSGILAIVVGITAGVLIGALVILVIRSLQSSDVQIIVAVIAAAVALITTGGGALINQGMNQRRDALVQRETARRQAEEAHRPKKVEMYDGFIALISDFIQGKNRRNLKKTPQGQGLLDRIEKFQNSLLLWASPKVIKAYLEFRVGAPSGDAKKIFECVNNLYLAIRSDLGLSNEGLDNLELVRIYLSDPTELDRL